MSDNMNSKREDDSHPEKKSEDPEEPNRPKHIFRKNIRNDPLRSKSAPAEEFGDVEDTEDYLSSYNYYIYYNSIKPSDPRLPKPTYKPKPNLDFIKESKDKEEEDEEQQEAGNDNSNTNANPIENLAKDMNQLRLEPNSSSPDNNQDLLGKNLFNDNFMNNVPKSQKNKNSFNSGNDAPSPFDYYSQSMNVPNQPNDISQQQMWNENLGMNQMGMGMYNPGLGGMVNLGMNSLNPMLGMNMGMNPYANLPQYQNIMGMNPSLMNANNRMNSGNGQFNNGRKNTNQKKETTKLKKA